MLHAMLCCAMLCHAILCYAKSLLHLPFWGPTSDLFFCCSTFNSQVNHCATMSAAVLVIP